MNCLIVEEEQIVGSEVVLRGAAVRHVREVLKKGPGDTVLAGLLDGPLGRVRILALDEATCRIEAPAGDPPPVPQVDLVLAMPRPKVMKRLWAPLASLGVGRIVVTGAARVESFYFSSHAVDEAVFRPRLIEGLEQAISTRLPQVEVFPVFADFVRDRLGDLVREAVGLLAHPGAAGRVGATVAAGGRRRTVIALGPEGGWREDELAVFSDHDFTPVGLGDRPYRTDTAVMALLALVHEARRDL